jgi:hypothetical protein
MSGQNDTADLIKRLRELAIYLSEDIFSSDVDLVNAAADRLEKQQAELNRLEIKMDWCKPWTKHLSPNTPADSAYTQRRYGVGFASLASLASDPGKPSWSADPKRQKQRRRLIPDLEGRESEFRQRIYGAKIIPEKLPSRAFVLSIQRLW